MPDTACRGLTCMSHEQGGIRWKSGPRSRTEMVNTKTDGSRGIVSRSIVLKLKLHDLSRKTMFHRTDGDQHLLIRRVKELHLRNSNGARRHERLDHRAVVPIGAFGQDSVAAGCGLEDTWTKIGALVDEWRAALRPTGDKGKQGQGHSPNVKRTRERQPLCRPVARWCIENVLEQRLDLAENRERNAFKERVAPCNAGDRPSSFVSCDVGRETRLNAL
ncbi:hypothetical protein BC567DRAFT_207560 [Phyllosticta citribraziliensis]